MPEKIKIRRPRPRKTNARPSPPGRTREMCFLCHRPGDLCHCNTIPRIENQTEILLVQHIRERAHPFNTGRMVKRSLVNANLIVDYSEKLSQHSDAIKDDAALLYPSKSAIDITRMPPGKRPKQLILLDGTWNQAKRLYRHWPALVELPHYKISPQAPGQYRIRQEPNENALSTVEAAVAALRVLEPGLAGLDALLHSFATMVERQLAHPKAKYQLEQLPRQHKINMPQSLIEEFENVVVAYGEAAPIDDFGQHKSYPRPPVYWVAKRLESGEIFSTTIQSDFNLSEQLLDHFDLNRNHFAGSSSIGQFKKLWLGFSRTTDILVVYNRSTLRLLQSVDVYPARSIELKSINFDPGKQFATLSDVFTAKQFPVDDAVFPGRAGRRLANVSTLVKYLSQYSLTMPSKPA